MASPSGGACGAGAECEGEEQEDPSSSNILDETTQILENLEITDEEVKPEGDALSVFREQWKRELKSTPSPQREINSVRTDPARPQEDQQEQSVDEKAKQLFLRGIELERSGALYEAVQHYKRAVQLQPDVERQLYAAEIKAKEEVTVPAPEPQPSEYAARASDPDDDDGDDDDEEGKAEGPVDLMAKFQRVLAKKSRWCEPLHPQQSAHVSCLPYECVAYICRWTAGAELDARALCRLAGACRGLYLHAREPALWRDMCLRTWGVDCGTPKDLSYPSWRHMYIGRARLRFDGCYISKTSYVRPGENAYQDQTYRPWYQVDYYRYFRFFPEGVVVVWTTAEPPAACVGALRGRAGAARGAGAAHGHYRLMGDKVVIVVRKERGERRAAAGGHSRFRSRRKDSLVDTDITYHIELQLVDRGWRRNWCLWWRAYSVLRRGGGGGGGGGGGVALDVPRARYPPLVFSPVAHYTARAAAPLT